ncbi:MAG: HAMP domain-containing sensor histidine kinase [Pseudomonadota bacterium]
MDQHTNGQHKTELKQDVDGSKAAEKSRSAPVPYALSSKLLLLTVLFVMISEVLIYVPSVANFRNTWLLDRLGDAETAALVISASPDGMVPSELEKELLDQVGVNMIAVRQEAVRRLIALEDMPPVIDATVDFRDLSPIDAIRQAFETLLRNEPQTLRAVSSLSASDEEFVEIVLNDTALRAAMLDYSTNILTLSLIISGITALLVYLSLTRLLVRPMRQLTGAMINFSHDPENAANLITPTGRRDEIGIAERELRQMQESLQSSMAQQRRLASLGLAVSKINHDLRNILASAQLISDRLGTIEDPTVQRFAPKLISTLDRAIDFCTSTLKYGSAKEAPPSRKMIGLRALADDVFETLGLDLREKIGCRNEVGDDLDIIADPDQLSRVLLNIVRNSVQALEAEGSGDPEADLVTISADRNGKTVRIEISDTGPGIPPRARDNLFQAFRGSLRPGGTGLGLAIAAEIVRAHGGTIDLVDSETGARFEIKLPCDTPKSAHTKPT